MFHLFDQSCEAVLVECQKGHKYGISAIAGSRDSSFEDGIASGDQDGNLIVWAANRDHLHKDATFPSYGYVIVLQSNFSHFIKVVIKIFMANITGLLVQAFTSGTGT